MLSPSYIILRIHRLEDNSVDLDEVAHYEPPNQDLGCLQIQLFSSLVVKELMEKLIGEGTLPFLCLPSSSAGTTLKGKNVSTE